MKELAQTIHGAMQNDSVANVGLQALLGYSTLPWGIYRGHFPERPSFKANDLLTWQFGSGPVVMGHKSDMRLRQRTFHVTAWSSTLDNIDVILARVRFIFESGLFTLPTVNCQIHRITYEQSGPDLWDEGFQVNYRADTFRVHYREDITLAGTANG